MSGPAGPAGRPVTEGVLSGHHKKGRLFTPPIMALSGSIANDWVRDDLPDLLWPLCLVATHGDSGAVLYRELQESVIGLIEKSGADGSQITIDGRLTTLEAVPDEVRNDIVELVRNHPRFSDLISPEVVGVMTLYPDMPGSWLLAEPWDDVDAIESEAAMNHIAEAMVEVASDRHLNALVKTSTFGWLVLTNKMTMPEELGELLSDYPLDESKRGAADAAILSSFLAFKTLDVQIDPTVEKRRGAWASRFWARNRELSACIPEHEVELTADGDDSALSDEAGEETSGEQEAEQGSNAVAELVFGYLDALGSMAEGLADKFYDPDLKLDLHRPARSEVIVGLATRAIRAIGVHIRAPHLWTTEHGANAMRLLFETRVTLRWLMTEGGDEAFEQYQSYGRGKRKLHKSHIEAVADDLGDAAPDELLSALEMYEAKTGGEWSEEFQVVSLESTFSGKSLREMADDIGEIDDYNHIFQVASGVTHGEWWAIEDYALQRCINPLHRFHYVPNFDLHEPHFEPRFPELLLGHLEEVLNLAVDGLDAAAGR